MKNISMIRVLLAAFVFAWLGFVPAGECFGLDITRSIHFYQLKSWAMSDGLPSNSVYSIVQGRDGYLWTAAETGLARFDGMQFDVFDRRNTPALPAAIIQQLLVDRQGNLWIASRGGGVIRFRDNTFKAFTREHGLLSDEVWTLMESGGGSIWVGSNSGLNRVQGDTVTAVSFIKPVTLTEVRALLEDRDGRIWVGTRVHGLFEIRRQGSVFEAVRHPGLKKVSIRALLEDRQGTLWIATADSGLIRLKGNNALSYDTRSGLTDDWVNALYQDSADNLWIGTQVGGLFVIRSGSGTLTRFQDQDKFVGNAIRAFHEDHEQTLWIGREGGGLTSIRNTKIAAYTKKHGLSSDNIFGIYQDREGTIWAGSRGNGVNIIKNGTITHLNTSNGLPANTSTSFASSKDGTMWIGTLGGGILRIKKGKYEVFDQRHGLTDRFVRCLYIEPSGTLWAGTDNGDLHYFQNGRFLLYWNFSSRINCILRDRNNSLWVCTSGRGVFLLPHDARKPVSYDSGSVLPGNKLCGLLEDHEGAIWAVAYGGGLCRFKDRRWTALTRAEGLPDEGLYWILEDGNHDLWVSSNVGIILLRRDDLDKFFSSEVSSVTPTVFGVDDGMIDPECNGGNQPAGWKDNTGKLWFPTTKGIVVIDPGNLGINKQMPPVSIKKVLLNGQPVSIEQAAELPGGSHKLEFHFTALSFIVSDKVLFKYRLENSGQWTAPSAERTAVFEDLPPGDYGFRVAACNSDGVWNHAGAVFRFKVTRRFHETLLFKIILFAGGGLFVLLFYFLFKKMSAHVKQKKRYKNSPLPETESEQWMETLDALMTGEKVYRSPEISLKGLAEKLDINQRLLSQLLNERMNINFYELINRYRVDEAKRLLTLPDSPKKSVLEIGFNVGFNSKTAFNRAFKHFTNMTPSQYRKKHQAAAASPSKRNKTR